MTPLPTVPSALIRVALADLYACEADDRYKIFMGTWHTPQLSGLCSVCLAGAVMAKSLDTNIAYHEHPIGFSNDVKNSLHALNLFRSGHTAVALQTLKQPIVLNDRPIVEYENDRVLFHSQMNTLADDLEELGV